MNASWAKAGASGIPAFVFRCIPVNERQLHWTPGRADPSLAVAAHQPTHNHPAVPGERRSEPAIGA
jgi:hypothetical protein